MRPYMCNTVPNAFINWKLKSPWNQQILLSIRKHLGSSSGFDQQLISLFEGQLVRCSRWQIKSKTPLESVELFVSQLILRRRV